jgi:integrase
MASGFRSGDNPVDGVTKGLPRQSGREDHHQAIPYAEMPAFIERICRLEMSPIARFGFVFLILTACRTNEVLGARWQEIDVEKALRDIPAIRMKGKRHHIVPLSPRCLEILMKQEPCQRCRISFFPKASVEHGFSYDHAADAAFSRAARFSLHVPRLGVRADQLSQRGVRDGARPCHPGQDGSCLPARRFVG